MSLRLEDISVFIANWEDKATNIKKIRDLLNVGFDSMVFLDDNKFERELVKSLIPEVCVPDLPEDPADYLPFLVNLNLFEAGVLSELDAERTQLIQMEVSRRELEQKYSNPHEFLSSLNMTATISKFTSFNTPRVAQLSERSNQYNLRTLRYTESDVLRISKDGNYDGIAIHLRDKFGDHGLISVVTACQDGTSLFIENWFMSCRVLKRGVEHVVIDKLVSIAQSRGCQSIVGEYIPTKKNALVQDHYEQLGFQKTSDNRWILSIEKHSSENYLIKVETND